MAVINPHVHTEQEVLNSSFDETLGVLVAQGLEYDPSGTAKRKVTDNLATKVTISGSDIYIGEASTGTAESSASWRAQKITVSSGAAVITWADGNDSFDNIATDLTALTYS